MLSGVSQAAKHLVIGVETLQGDTIEFFCLSIIDVVFKGKPVFKHNQVKNRAVQLFGQPCFYFKFKLLSCNL